MLPVTSASALNNQREEIAIRVYSISLSRSEVMGGALGFTLAIPYFSMVSKIDSKEEDYQ